MIKQDPSVGEYMACSLLYRGDVTPIEAASSMGSLRKQRTINFVDFIPTGFKVSINSNTPTVFDHNRFSYQREKRSCCLLSNNTSISNVFADMSWKFDLLYQKRAFLHWHIDEGCGEGLQSEAREDIAALERDYR